MIDRSWKLQRYDRKDYSDLVEFPVEIVGRDGVVRRYSFEDSIRLYQRRISFAPVRYRERDLVGAELTHCRARIDQLRRSYFHRFGWAAELGRMGPEVGLGTLAGELAAFLGRVLRSEGRVDVRIDPVNPEPDGAGTWYVTAAGARTGMLLYVYRFDGEAPGEGPPVTPPAAEAIREGFFRQVKDLERIGHPDGDTERLLAFHHTLDCAFVLSGDADAAAVIDARAGEEGDGSDAVPTPWDVVVDAVRRGDPAAALSRCRQVVVDQPWHRQAYRAGALLAISAEDSLLAEEFALLGSKYFPADSVLRYYLAVTWSRQGRLDESEAAVREALALDPRFSPARLFLAQHLVARGRWSEITALTRPQGGGEDAPIQRELTLLRLRSLARRALAAGAGLALVSGALAGGDGWPIPAVGLCLLSSALGAAFALASRGGDPSRGVRVEDPAIGLRRLLRREGNALVS